MDKIIKNILKKIENEGYEAYIVGGFVRDFLLGKFSYDVDICTNALPKNVIEILPLNKKTNGYGGFNFKVKKYNIDITTYRKEIKYQGRNPIEIEYISNLLEDIKRRDFTINSMCMDKNGNIIDLLDGQKDLNKHLIKAIGNASKKFSEDPLRMLRAIRFATVLDFEIEPNTLNAIKANFAKVSTLSSTRIKEELTKILASTNFQKGLNLLRETKIDEALKLKYDKVVYTCDILGMWAQIESDKVVFSNNEKDNIARIKSLVQRGKINNHDLFTNGLYVSLVAGEILGFTHNEINKRFKSLPIKSMKDIDISGKEVMDLLGLEPGKKVSEIMGDIKNAILNKEITNKKSEIKKYLVRK